MKYLCRACETYMEYESHEALDEGSLGIAFGCTSCGSRFMMITNPGETMLVQSLGVKLGGAPLPPEPLELTRATLAECEGDTGSPTWEEGARIRIERAPEFVRPMAIKAVEQFAVERGHTLITEVVLDEYKAGQPSA